MKVTTAKEPPHNAHTLLVKPSYGVRNSVYFSIYLYTLCGPKSTGDSTPTTVHGHSMWAVLNFNHLFQFVKLAIKKSKLPTCGNVLNSFFLKKMTTRFFA